MGEIAGAIINKNEQQDHSHQPQSMA